MDPGRGKQLYHLCMDPELTRADGSDGAMTVAEDALRAEVAERVHFEAARATRTQRSERSAKSLGGAPRLSLAGETSGNRTT